MTTEELLEMNADMMVCKHCAFNENCESLWKTCAVNFILESDMSKIAHLKCCEIDNWNTLDEQDRTNIINMIHSYEQDMDERFSDDDIENLTDKIKEDE